MKSNAEFLDNLEGRARLMDQPIVSIAEYRRLEQLIGQQLPTPEEGESDYYRLNYIDLAQAVSAARACIAHRVRKELRK